MKFFVTVILVFSMLCGCTAKDNPLEQTTALREELLEAEGCTFQATITADYESAIHTFAVSCSVDTVGTLNFTVTEPDTISGITGYISDDDASITFDDKVLAFQMLADGQISPISTPWLFLKALRGGYISGCSANNAGLCIYIDDSFREYPLQIEVYADVNTIPYHVDFIWQNRRILSLDIQDFVIL